MGQAQRRAVWQTDSSGNQFKEEVTETELRLRIIALEADVAAIDSAITVSGYAETISAAATTWTIDHNLNTKNLIVRLKDSSQKLFTAQSVEATSVNQIVATMNTALAGSVVVAAGTSDYRSYAEEITLSAGANNIAHGLNTKHLAVEIWKDDKIIWVGGIEATDDNNLSITVSDAISIRIVIIAANVSFRSCKWEDFTSSSQWVMSHIMDSQDIVTEIWKNDKIIGAPSTVMTDSSTITVDFGSSISGTLVGLLTEDLT